MLAIPFILHPSSFILHPSSQEILFFTFLYYFKYFFIYPHLKEEIEGETVLGHACLLREKRKRKSGGGEEVEGLAVERRRVKGEGEGRRVKDEG